MGLFELQGTADPMPLSAQILQVEPNPRNVSVDSITVQFSQVVTGFDGEDLALTRDGVDLVLAPVVTQQGLTFTIDGLKEPTNFPGTYQVTLAASGSEIADLAGNRLAQDVVMTWVDNRIIGDSHHNGVFNSVDWMTMEVASLNLRSSPTDRFISSVVKASIVAKLAQTAIQHRNMNLTLNVDSHVRSKPNCRDWSDGSRRSNRKARTGSRAQH